ncbi:cadherin EGF LAG seven-pass G-type receptor fmi-1-like [Mytilus galloprovincialis]|uniref:cadherin EGF LAG seven-pass G-type receptor fmi-1-like n=1 Tax=Mytilus galloprovincialis TaxID=29158 RepID=UPI003F7C58AD
MDITSSYGILLLISWSFNSLDIGLCNEYCSNSSLFYSDYGVYFNDSDTLNDTLASPIYSYSDLLSGFLSFRNRECNNSMRFKENELFLTIDLMKDCNKQSFSCQVDCGGLAQSLELRRNSLPSGKVSFKESQYSQSIPENFSPFVVFDVTNEISQTDCYSLNKGELVMKSNDTGPFSIVGNEVRLVKGLDYDKEKKVYNVTLSYEQPSKAQKVRETVTQLIITVQDVDDMDPMFNQTEYVYDIYENETDTEWKDTTPPIYAYDRDVGEGRQNLSYSFMDNSVLNDVVAINTTTGRIQVRQQLDREKIHEYVYAIKAVQNNNNLRSATASLKITVLDVNDNLPIFEIPFVDVDIDEHSSHGSFICQVSAHDGDLYPFNLIRYDLSKYQEIFYIDQDKGKPGGVIKVNDSYTFDREKLGDAITMSVIAYDVSNSTNEREGGNMTVNINIFDINDNTPKFVEPHGYTFSGDNLGIVGQVNATDEDSPLNGNGDVRYFIPPFPDDNRVTIDSNSGYVNLTSHIIDTLDFNVKACDQPVQQVSRCDLVLIVLAKNLTTTEHVKIEANVSENVRPGTIVTFIGVKGGTVTYKVIGEESMFKVNESSGVVSTAGNIDREDHHDEYLINIHVLTKTHQIHKNITLSIEILDVNDNPPVFENADYFFHLPASVSTGLSIGNINATDKDSGSNAVIEFSFPDTILSPYFTVNKTSGDISLSGIDLPTGKDLFQLIVIARDNGTPPLQSSCNVYVSRTITNNAFVRIETPIEASKLKGQKFEYERKLSTTLSLDVTIKEIVPVQINTNGISQSRSLMDIFAKNQTGTVLPSAELQRIVLQNMEAVQALFFQQIESTVESKTSSLSASQIALIVLAAIILIGGILFIMFIFKTRKRLSDEISVNSVDEEKVPIDEQKGPIADRISTQSIEVTVELGEELEKTSDYDGSQNSNEQAISESNALGTINPAFQNDTETLDMTEISAISTTDEAEQQLNQLNELLNMEENKASITDYHIEDTVTDSKGGKNVDDDNAPHVSNDTGSDLYPPKADYTNINNLRSENEQLNENEYLAVNEDIKDELNESSGLPQADYENNENETQIGGNNDHVLDQESGEFIMSPDKVDDPDIDYNTSKVTHSDENSVDVQDEEPDIDYNEKQVRFSTVVLDSEENKFEPLKTDVDDQSDVLSNENETPDDSVDGEEETTENETINDETDINESDKSLLLAEEETTAF